MDPDKPSMSLRNEVGIQSECHWNPYQFRVPRFYAFDLGTMARKIVLYGVVALLAYRLFQFFWH